MARTSPALLPRLTRMLQELGANIRRARLRRAYPAQIVAERAGIVRATLVRVERGDPAVALGIYARVLQALGLETDLQHIAADDKLGLKLQDAALGERARTPRRKQPMHPP